MADPILSNITITTGDKVVPQLKELIERFNHSGSCYLQYCDLLAIKQLIATSLIEKKGKEATRAYLQEWQQKNSLTDKIKNNVVASALNNIAIAQSAMKDRGEDTRDVETVKKNIDRLFTLLTGNFDQFTQYQFLMTRIKLLEKFISQVLTKTTDVNLVNYLNTVKDNITKIMQVPDAVREESVMLNDRSLQFYRAVQGNKKAIPKLTELFDNLTPDIGSRIVDQIAGGLPPDYKNVHMGGHNPVWLVSYKENLPEEEKAVLRVFLEEMGVLESLQQRMKTLTALPSKDAQKIFWQIYGETHFFRDAIFELSQFLPQSLQAKLDDNKNDPIKGNRYLTDVDKIRDEAIYYLFEALAIAKTFDNNKLVFPDLKPGNFLINPQGHLVISDLKAMFLENEFVSGRVIPTKAYMGPEIYKGEGYSLAGLKKGILHTIGVTAYQAATGEVPRSPSEYKFDLPVFQGEKGKFLKEMIKSLTNVNPDARINYDDAMKKMIPVVFPILTKAQIAWFIDYTDPTISKPIKDLWIDASKDMALKTPKRSRSEMSPPLPHRLNSADNNTTKSDDNSAGKPELTSWKAVSKRSPLERDTSSDNKTENTDPKQAPKPPSPRSPR